MQHPLVWPALTLVLLCAAGRCRSNRRFLHLRVARRPSVRRADRHPQPRRAARARVARHDARDRDARHRHLGGRRGRDRGRGRGLLIGGALADDRQRGRRCRSRSPRARRRRCCAGMWNGLLVAVVGMQPIIATLILMVAGRGVAQLLTGGQIITIYYAPLLLHRQRLSARPAVLGVHRGCGGRA